MNREAKLAKADFASSTAELTQALDVLIKLANHNDLLCECRFSSPFNPPDPKSEMQPNLVFNLAIGSHLFDKDFRMLSNEPMLREVAADSLGLPVADVGNGRVHGAVLPVGRQRARAQLHVVRGQQGEEAGRLLIEGLLDSEAVGDCDS